MATLVQFAKLQTSDDVITRLQSGTVGNPVAINARNITNLPTTAITTGEFADARIPNLNASKINAGVLADAQIPNLAATKITTGTLPAARINLGNGLRANANGSVEINPGQAINLGDVETYATTALRNAATDVQWHRGDIAIITTGVDIRNPTQATDTRAGTYVYSATDQATAGATTNANWTRLVTIGEVDWAIDGTERINNNRVNLPEFTPNAGTGMGTQVPINDIALSGNTLTLRSAGGGTLAFTPTASAVPDVYEVTVTLPGPRDYILTGSGATSLRPVAGTSSTRTEFPMDERSIASVPWWYASVYI